MDKILKEERTYLLNICKKIKKANCNVLLIQKSILRDAVTDLSLHFLAKLKILVIKDVERDEIEFLSKSLGCKPISDIEAFTEDKLGYADLVDETSKAGTKIVKITGVKAKARTVSVLAMGANSLVLEECERSLHDALCVVRCLVKKRYVLDMIRLAMILMDWFCSLQCTHCRRRSPGDPRITDACAIRTVSQRLGGILLPSIRRCAGGYSNNTGRKCRLKPYRNRD